MIHSHTSKNRFCLPFSLIRIKQKIAKAKIINKIATRFYSFVLSPRKDCET